MSPHTEPIGPPCRYSVVVPMHNEEAYVEPMAELLTHAMASLGESYELIFVDDGSTDATFALLERLAESNPRVRVISLRRNYGQTPALSAGFDHAAGEIVIAMDADLRSSPSEIPLLLEKLAEGNDVVCGWRRDRRHEGALRTLPSSAANWLLARISGQALHDFGTTFKAYRREVLRDLRLYGEQHRFIPVLAGWVGARIAEVPVGDNPRQFGKSHYGLGRILRVPFDLITLKFLQHYRMRPMGFFGPVALAGLGSGALMLLYVLVHRLLAGETSAGGIVMGALLMVAGLQMLGLGLLAELQVRQHYQAGHESIYQVERVVRAAALTRSAR